MWITITEADVLTVLAGPELSGYRAAAKAVGQDDPVAPTIAQVTQLVRGYVAACASNRLGEIGTIPQELLPAALDILAVRIPQRVGKKPADVRKDAQDDAIKLLEQTAACKFVIESPVIISEQKISSPSPHIAPKCRRFTHRQQEGA